MPQHEVSDTNNEEDDLNGFLSHQLEDLTFYDVQFHNWLDSLKLAIERWIELNWFILRRKCHYVAHKYRFYCSADDLVNDCIVEIYRMAPNYDPNKGEFDHWVSKSIYFYMFRRDVIKRYKSRVAICVDDLHIEDKSEENNCDSDHVSVVSLIEGFPAHEQQLLRLKYLGNLNNSQIARMIGISEATIRYRLQKILEKIKISGS